MLPNLKIKQKWNKSQIILNSLIIIISQGISQAFGAMFGDIIKVIVGGLGRLVGSELIGAGLGSGLISARLVSGLISAGLGIGIGRTTGNSLIGFCVGFDVYKLINLL